MCERASRVEPEGARSVVEHAQFVALFRAEYAKLCRIAARLVHDRALAEEIVSESMLTVWRRRQHIDWDRPFPYVYRVVINECKDALETAGKQRALQSRVATLDLVPHQRTTTAAVEPHVTGDAAVLEMLQQLPLQQRSVVVLRVYEDMSELDVAEVLGISVGSVKSHYSRGLAALRTAMTDTSL
jgi:RNA polymerase sigma factor (sigma-70 family)